MVLKCYSTEDENILLEFWACKNDENISWEDWHQCTDPLIIYHTDYSRLLIPYFKKISPFIDPTNGEIQEYFDVCGVNWIGKNSWIQLLNIIQADSFKDEKEQNFYYEFSAWIRSQLSIWDVIEVNGNQ